MPASAERRKVKAKYARAVGLANARPGDPQVAAEVDQLKAEYRYLSAADYIKQLVDGAPELSERQKSALAALLAPRDTGRVPA